MKGIALKDCQQGDWVYYDAGNLFMVDKEEGIDYFSLTDGHFRVLTSDDSIVYPLTLHNKIIADGIHYYYKEMHTKGLINGSKWVNWLYEKMSELMEMEEDSPREEFEKIWNLIDEQVKELEYHKSFLE